MPSMFGAVCYWYRDALETVHPTKHHTDMYRVNKVSRGRKECLRCHIAIAITPMLVQVLA